jgi:hypothetical protein
MEPTLYQLFLFGFLTPGFIGFVQSIRVCYLEFTDPVFDRSERWMIFACIGIILVYIESVFMLAYTLNR